MIPLSVCILTYNEESNLAACLESVRWAGEVLILDSGSTDRTLEIAKGFGAKILHRPFTNFVEQRKFHFAAAAHDWVFYLDADERCTPQLQKEIQEAFRALAPEFAGFSIPRLSYFLGSPIRHCGWYPDRTIRIFDRRRYELPETLHGKLAVPGPVKELRGDLLHFPYKDLSHHLAKMNSYTSESAEGKFRSGRRVGVFAAGFVAPWRFLKMYFFQLGFLDGRAGFALSLISAFGDTMKYLKLYEKRMRSAIDT